MTGLTGTSDATWRCTRCGRQWVMMGLLAQARDCLICGGAVVVEDDPALARADPVRGAVSAFNEQDADRMLQFMSPRIVWRPTGVLLGSLTRSYEGLEDMRTWTNEVAGLWSEVRFIERHVHLVRDAEVLMIGALTATSRGTGTGLAEPIAILFRVEDGLVDRMEEYLDLVAARRAAGVPTAS